MINLFQSIVSNRDAAVQLPYSGHSRVISVRRRSCVRVSDGYRAWHQHQMGSYEKAVNRSSLVAPAIIDLMYRWPAAFHVGVPYMSHYDKIFQISERQEQCNQPQDCKAIVV